MTTAEESICYAAHSCFQQLQQSTDLNTLHMSMKARGKNSHFRIKYSSFDTKEHVYTINQSRSTTMYD